MGAAAQLTAVAVDRDHANAVPVFLVEQRHRPGRQGVLVRHHLRPHGEDGEDLLIHPRLEPGAFVRGDGAEVQEVEPQPVRRHTRPCLARVLAQDLPKGTVQEVGRGVIPHDVPPARGVHHETRGLPHPHLPGHPPAVDHEARDRTLGVRHRDHPARGPDLAGVPDLSSRLRVERRLVADDLHVVARGGGFDLFPGAKQGDDAAGRLERLVPDELARHPRPAERRVRAAVPGVGLKRPRLSGAFLLAGFLRIEPGLIDLEPVFPRDVPGQVPGKSVSVVQTEHVGPRRRVSAIRSSSRPSPASSVWWNRSSSAPTTSRMNG